MIHIFGIQLSDLTNISLVIIAAVGTGFAIRQLRITAKSQHASFLKDWYLAFANGEILDALTMVEYNDFKFMPDDRLGSPYRQQELKLNALLAFANGLCAQRRMKLISPREARFFRYLVTVLYTNKDVRMYYAHLVKNVFDEAQKKAGGKPYVLPYFEFANYCCHDLKLGRLGQVRSHL